MYHMLPQGMMGRKCHPPLSTTPEVWRRSAGRQASRTEAGLGIQLMNVFYAAPYTHTHNGLQHLCPVSAL